MLSDAALVATTTAEVQALGKFRAFLRSVRAWLRGVLGTVAGALVDTMLGLEGSKFAKAVEAEVHALAGRDSAFADSRATPADGESFSLSPLGPHVRMIREQEVPEVHTPSHNPFAQIPEGQGSKTWTDAWRDWVKGHRDTWRIAVTVPEGDIRFTHKTERHMSQVTPAEGLRYHYEAAAELPVLLKKSVLAAVDEENKGKERVAEVHHRYAWMAFSDGAVRNVAITVLRWNEDARLSHDTAYAEEVQMQVLPNQVYAASAAPHGLESRPWKSSEEKLSAFTSGIKPEHRWHGVTHSLSPVRRMELVENRLAVVLNQDSEQARKFATGFSGSSRSGAVPWAPGAVVARGLRLVRSTKCWARQPCRPRRRQRCSRSASSAPSCAACALGCVAR